jgi:hypothetical protein
VYHSNFLGTVLISNLKFSITAALTMLQMEHSIPPQFRKACSHNLNLAKSELNTYHVVGRSGDRMGFFLEK